MSRKSPAHNSQPLPHSWAVSDWPPGVFPGPVKAHYFTRANEDALIKAGALVRIGRKRVILGAPFAGFLQDGAARVKHFAIQPNRSPSAAA